MVPSNLPNFAQGSLLEQLAALDDAALDALDFGVIGFGKDAEALVSRYNAVESRGTGMDRSRIVGRPLFTQIAQCMNNFLVAQRFDDAVAAGQELDETVDFTLTWRMRPTPVRLRLLSSPRQTVQYVAIERQS